MKTRDRGNYKLKRDGPFVNINCRNIIVEQNRDTSSICMSLVILCKYEKLSL